MKLVYWGKHITFFQLSTLEQLEHLLGERIGYYVVDRENQIRMEQGWLETGYYSNEVVELKSGNFCKNVYSALRDNPDAIHLFFGFWSDKRLFLVLLFALSRGYKVAVMYEPYLESSVGYWKDEPVPIAFIKSLIRKAFYKITWPIIKEISINKPPCFFPLSQLAKEQLVKDGFDDRYHFPTGYFIKKEKVESNPKHENGQLRLVFSGSLIKRKGLDVAVKSISLVNQRKVKVTLDIYGSGDIPDYLDASVPGITYRGRYAPAEAQQVISNYDALLVPSRHEGWGVVVVEALLQGVPVIVSDQVGSKCIVESTGSGVIFPNEDHEVLASILESLYRNPDRVRELQEKANFTSDIIRPESAAQHMYDSIQYHFFDIGNKPIPIWKITE